MKENKKLLQINSVVNRGSTGRIVEGIGKVASKNGWESHIIYGRYANHSHSNIYNIGTKKEIYSHILLTRLFDRHGFGSKKATMNAIDLIKRINPDIIHLHNIHGYYLNIEILYDFFKIIDKPIVWTLHDCWAFTGHCSHYSDVSCSKWKSQCHDCPIIKSYPKSLFVDNSTNNFIDKKRIFLKPSNLTVVTPSLWLANEVSESFLKIKKNYVINNGINLEIFNQNFDDSILKKYNITENQYIIGVASEWTETKGLKDFIALRELVGSELDIVIVGVTKKQKASLPKGIKGILRTEDVRELTALYSSALCFLNPTWQDNFPTTNLEALACGTPVITYKTGGSPESIDALTGLVVDQGDIKGLNNAILYVKQKTKKYYEQSCILRAKKYYNENSKFTEYLEIYNQLLN